MRAVVSLCGMQNPSQGPRVGYARGWASFLPCSCSGQLLQGLPMPLCTGTQMGLRAGESLSSRAGGGRAPLSLPLGWSWDPWG